MKGSNFILFLERSMEENLIVSVFSNKYEPDRCSTGFVGAITEEQVLIKHVTPKGLRDGYVIRRLEDVFRVDINGQYEQKLMQLYCLQNQCHQDFLVNQVSNEMNLFIETLVSAQKLGMVISIDINIESQSDIVGIVKEVSDIEVIVSRITEDGMEDGESVIYIDDIVKLNCDTDDEYILQLLYQNRKRC